MLRFCIFAYQPMQQRINWDAIGIFTSLACAIHCAVLPLVISAITVFDVNLVNNELFEWGMIVAACIIGAYALLHGYRKHHHEKLPLVLFFTGMLLLIGKQLWHQYQLWILPFAVLAIISAHLLNFRATAKTRRLPNRAVNA